MSMTKRHLESLPAVEQDAILGAVEGEEEYWAAYDVDCKTVAPPVGPDDHLNCGDLDEPWM